MFNVLNEASNTRCILAFPYSHTLSHVSRSLLLAIELRNRGYNVVFAGGGSKSSFIAQEGFEIFPVYEPAPELLFGNIREGRLRFISRSEIEKMIAADLDLYRGIKPDLVLSDGRFTAPISTQVAGVKHAAIVNVSSTEYRAHSYVPVFNWVLKTGVQTGSPLWKLLEFLNTRLEIFIFNNTMSVFNQLSRSLRLNKPVTATNCLTGMDVTLLADIPEYFPSRGLPPHYYYIGPLTFQTDMQEPAWWPPKKRSGRLIYLTMGTTGLKDFFYNVHELFRNSSLTAVVTTGGQVEGLESIDGVVYMEKFMNGDRIIEESDLIVCHGGNGTIYQALKHGRPIIGLPTIADQRFNMRRVEALGVGLTVRWEDFTKNPGILMNAIHRVLREERFAQNACRLQSIINRYDSKTRGADIVEQLLSET